MRLTNSEAAVKVPATTANLGPGFDCLGLALDLSDRVRVRALATGKTHVTVKGYGQDTLPNDNENLIVKVLRGALDIVGAPQVGFEVLCENNIPQSRGLGSSAAAITAGLMLARGLISDPDAFDNATLLRLATQIEGHPDNVAPAIYGGIVLSGMHRAPSKEELGTCKNIEERFEDVAHLQEKLALPCEAKRSSTKLMCNFGNTEVAPFGDEQARALADKGFDSTGDYAQEVGLDMSTLPETWIVDVKNNYPLTPTLFIPEYELETRKSRGLLPEMVPHGEAVANSTNTALLIYALTNRPDLLFSATRDYLHQDYRREGMPRSLDLMYWLRSVGYPAVISGAGPTVLVLGSVDEAHKVSVEKYGWRVRSIPLNQQGAALIA